VSIVVQVLRLWQKYSLW